MPGNKKPRKKHSVVNRAMRIYAQEQRVTARRPMDKRQVVEISVSAYLALEAMMRGHGNEDHYHNLACSLNYALVLCELGVGAEYIDIPQRARRGLVEAQARGAKTGRWGLSGPSIGDIRMMLELHDQQLELVTQGQLREAQKIIHERRDAGEFYTIETEALAA
jgi:hypothetical protein